MRIILEEDVFRAIVEDAYKEGWHNHNKWGIHEDWEGSDARASMLTVVRTNKKREEEADE